jgi:hypothetical protein
MSPMLRPALLAALALGALASPAAAQGSLAVQGFGYPPGQLSSRSLTTGGALGEMDHLSPLNPATLLGLGGATLYFQAEPEFRSVRVPGGEAKTTTARYPLVFGGFQPKARWAFALSSSTLADRSWQTTVDTLEQVAGDTARSSSTYRSEGAINDLRLGVAYGANSWLRLGIGLHAFSGRNRIFIGRNFVDDRFADFGDTSTISYGGNAVSVGAEMRVQRVASVALSARKGGRMSAKTSAGDSTLGHGDVPDRFAASVAYLGIANSVIAARVAQEKWSGLQGLGTPSLQPHDVTDIGVGGDIAGPRFGSRVIMLRLGGRWRDLPFAVPSSTGVAAEVKETSFAGGLGTFLAGGRAAVDLGLVRASRTSSLDATERAWILSVGLTVRP